MTQEAWGYFIAGAMAGAAIIALIWLIIMCIQVRPRKRRPGEGAVPKAPGYAPPPHTIHLPTGPAVNPSTPPPPPPPPPKARTEEMTFEISLDTTQFEGAIKQIGDQLAEFESAHGETVRTIREARPIKIALGLTDDEIKKLDKEITKRMKRWPGAGGAL